MDERDLPEGVIDADPPGGWESGATADGETAEQSADAEGSPKLTDAAVDGAAHAARPSNDPADEGTAPAEEPDEGSVQLDPDLSVDRPRENEEEQ